ncbi:MAG: transporter, permease protein [Acidimicrobiales bacterium]|nr:transporter, permease protein [Acidimicrobiales bacterium]
MTVTELDDPAVGFARPLRAFLALVGRDVFVLRQNLMSVVLRVTMQPLLFVFVFTYVFPKVGQGIGGAQGGATFALLLVPGTMGATAVMQGISAVAMPLIGDLGFAREIDDRALAPMPESLLGLQKIVGGAAEGLLATLLVFPLARFIPLTPVHLDVNWVLLPVGVVLASLLGGALGLAVGATAKPEQVPMVYSLVVLPLTFLGASYFPWRTLDGAPVLKGMMLLNPLLYVNELLRAALAPSVPHMPWPASLLGTLAFLLVLTAYGNRQLRRRLRND